MPPASRQTALITGASSGIGYELAKRFAQAGHNLVLVARGKEEMETLARELTAAHGVDVLVIARDLADPDSPRQIVHELQEKGIGVDFLVNNAGFGAQGRFADLDENALLGILQVNIAALTILTRRLLPPMLTRGKGRIMNVASTAAFQPGPYMAAYYASKAFVLSLSQALFEELRKKGITVTALCPGPTRTAFDQRAGMTKSGLFQGSVMDAAIVAHAGYEGMIRGKRLVVPGWRNKLLAIGSRFAPTGIVLKITKKLNRPKAGLKGLG